MRIASNIIETIKAKADIVEVIGEYVHLTKKGQNYTGLCPFHNDSTPSLTVSSAKGIYKCFACDASGDVIKFLQEYLNISFVEAVKMLAKKYGIEIPEDSYSSIGDEDQRKRESMFIINDYASKYYDVRTFGIGYACNSWNSFTQWAKEKGLDKDLLLELGLVKKKSMSDDVYDTFRGRIMIPIRDKQHRIIAFTSRILPDILANDPNVPKYINSSTSLIYDKGNSLFGIDVAWNAASKAGVMNLVEGAPDVMRLQIIGAIVLPHQARRQIDGDDPLATIIYFADYFSIQARQRAIQSIPEQAVYDTIPIDDKLFRRSDFHHMTRTFHIQVRKSRLAIRRELSLGIHQKHGNRSANH